MQKLGISGLVFVCVRIEQIRLQNCLFGKQYKSMPFGKPSQRTMSSLRAACIKPELDHHSVFRILQRIGNSQMDKNFHNNMVMRMRWTFC